jgi:hypothetical protein
LAQFAVDVTKSTSQLGQLVTKLGTFFSGIERRTLGVPVLGYDVDRSNASPKLVVNSEEATQVRRIFDLYVKLGSLLPVVEELSRRGWRNLGPEVSNSERDN